MDDSPALQPWNERSYEYEVQVDALFVFDYLRKIDDSTWTLLHVLKLKP